MRYRSPRMAPGANRSGSLPPEDEAPGVRDAGDPADGTAAMTVGASSGVSASPHDGQVRAVRSRVAAQRGQVGTGGF